MTDADPGPTSRATATGRTRKAFVRRRRRDGMGDVGRPIDDEGGPDRVVALSDGVIAIVITILVLDLAVPTVPPGSPPSVLARAVAAQWQTFVGFALSFLVVGLYWMLHRRTFLRIERYERGLVAANLFVLLAVAFVPYATAVFAAHPNEFGVAFLAATLATVGVGFALLWVYAARRGLVDPGLSSRSVRLEAARFLATPAVFVVSIGVAAVDPGLAVLSWFFLLPLNGALFSRLAERASVATTEADAARRRPE